MKHVKRRRGGRPVSGRATRPIHATILKRRKELELTQEQLGALVGGDKTMISHWERGKCAPNPRRMPALAEALQMDIDVLLSELVA